MQDNLDEVLDDIWTRWIRGSVDRRSSFHSPAVSSLTADNAPDQRIMVLRKVDRNAGVLRFHTDVRSTKVAQFARNSAVSVIGYDHGSKIQLRAHGRSEIVRTGPLADTAWLATSSSGRRSYLTTLPPGTVSATPTSGLPVAYETAAPSSAESEIGRDNFAIVPITLERLEWLHLAATGHRRAAFVRTGDTWSGQWLVP